MNKKKQVLLAPFSTFGIGGNADIWYSIYTQEDLYNVVSEIKKNDQSFFCLGGGSNILFNDKGLRIPVLSFENRSIVCDKKRKILECEAGGRMVEVFREAKLHELDFSLFSTIPGTIGGATVGNAGLPNQEIKDIFVQAEIFDTQSLEFQKVGQDFFQFSYRHTLFHTPVISSRYILWKVWITLSELSAPDITEKAKSFLRKRKEKQPWGKTGGSFFKNPPEGSAGYFLEQVGMKGYKHKGAFFSEKHANFMMNDGTATGKSILELAYMAQQKVWQAFSVRLEREVKVLDEWGRVQRDEY